MSLSTNDSEPKSTIKVLQEVRSPSIPVDAHVMTVLIEGEAPRVLRAGDAFWGPGGDVIHYQDANNRTDIPCSFVLTMLCVPGRPMRQWVTEEELEARKGLRVKG